MNFYARRSDQTVPSFKERLVRSSGAMAFCMVCVATALHAAKDRNAALSEISFRLEEMEKEKQIVLQKREDLLACLESESDPAWQELVLMKELGVVPEGWIKVHFK